MEDLVICGNCVGIRLKIDFLAVGNQHVRIIYAW